LEGGSTEACGHASSPQHVFSLSTFPRNKFIELTPHYSELRSLVRFLLKSSLPESSRTFQGFTQTPTNNQTLRVLFTTAQLEFSPLVIRTLSHNQWSIPGEVIQGFPGAKNITFVRKLTSNAMQEFLLFKFEPLGSL